MKKVSAFAFASTLLFLPTLAHASGFALNEESASVLGTAYAGATVSNEPAVIFSNPAGISGLKGTQTEMGGTMYRIDGASFDNEGTRTVGGVLATGNNSSNDELTAAPFGYYTRQLNEDYTFGVGLYSPFGLVTEYNPSWVGRYTSIESHLNTTEINPVLAYQATSKLSIGGGPVARYTEAKLTQAIDFGALSGGTSQSSDGAVKLEGDGFGYGFKFGLKYDVDDDTQVGLGYKSRMTTPLSGHATYTLSAAGAGVAAVSGAFKGTDISSDINTPQSVDLSASHRLSQPLTVYGDLLWTGWSTFKDLEFSYNNANQPSTTILENWKDTIRASIGASYDLTPVWTLRAGYSFDQSPVKNATYTTARVPDGDRNWLAIGAGYKASSNLRFDVAYDHLFLNSASSNNTVPSSGTLIGAWNSVSADLFTLNATYGF